MSNVVLSVKDLSVQFNHNKVLENITFEVEEGATLAIIGPNGSGKTVLFRALIGAIPYTGEINWSKEATIGYVPQRLDLDPHLSLTLRDFWLAKIKLDKLPVSSTLNDILKISNLEQTHLPVRLNKLSAGQLQRAMLGFAFIGNPNVIMLDEPTSGVDLPREEHVYHTIHVLQEQKKLTVILISHDLHLVYGHAKQVLCLNKKLLCAGPPRILTPEILSEVYGEHVSFEHEKHKHAGL